MEFLAAVLAIVAIILALHIRKRIKALEAHVLVLDGRLELRTSDGARGASQAASRPPTPGEPVIAPKPQAAEPAVSVPQSPPRSAQPDEAAIDAVFAAAAQHA